VRTIILCGGRGTRAYPSTLDLPKPLMDVGGRPVLAHLMDIYAAQGFTEFVLAAGYLGEQLVTFAKDAPAAWDVEVVDTGEDTKRGARVLQLADRVGDPFFLTYGDGLGNVDLQALLDFHRSHPGAATMTTVPLPSPYGTLHIDGGGRVHGFSEKPRLPDHPINAGFFVFDRRVFDLWPDPGEDLEREVLVALSERDELFAFEHAGFWKSMDTYKDSRALGALCADGPGPWMDQPGAASSA
jgi:glucose-1-phosphate cytidylyltransferase